MNKRISVVRAESGIIDDLAIMPGTTTQDVIRQIGLDGQDYVLTKGRGEEPFADSEELYGQLPDGSKLWLCQPIEVGVGAGRIPHLPFSRYLPSFIERFAWRRTIGYTETGNIKVITGNSNSIFPVTRKMASNVVTRDNRPYWAQRNWKENRNSYHGYFRTKYGSFPGKATVSPSKEIKLFIKKPPKELKAHEHSSCFTKKTGGWYSVHVYDGLNNLSSGIIEVEKILKEAIENAHT